MLWNDPGLSFYLIGGAGAVIQLIGLFYLSKDLKESHEAWKRDSLGRIALAAFVLKLVLQFLSAFPPVVIMGVSHRGLIIAYLHLVLLGVVTIFFLSRLNRIIGFFKSRQGRWGFGLFLFAFLSTETILLSQSFINWPVKGIETGLLVCTVFFPVGIVLMSRFFLNH